MESADRISQLPQDLLQHVLSFLGIKEIVQASSASKTWQQAWNTFPILDFGHEFFCSLSKYSYSHSKNLRKELFDFVEKTLLARHIQKMHVEKFNLYLPLNDDDDRDFTTTTLNRLIGYAVESSVQDLKLWFDDQHYLSQSSKYKLPASLLLGAKSLTSLDLWGCELDISDANAAAVRFPTLKILSLFKVCSNDDSIQALVGGCPRIEAMSFSSCKGFKNLHLHRLFMLTHLEISNSELEKITVEAPNLDSICVWAPSERLELNMAACKNLKSFGLFWASAITDRWLNAQLSNFIHLESLSLRNCCKLQNIKVFSPHLQKLDISYCDELDEIEFDSPYLLTFVYFWGIASIVSKKLSLMRSNAYSELSLESYDHFIFSCSTFSGAIFCSQQHKYRSVAFQKSHLLCHKGEEFFVPGETIERIYCP